MPLFVLGGILILLAGRALAQQPPTSTPAPPAPTTAPAAPGSELEGAGQLFVSGTAPPCRSHAYPEDHPPQLLGFTIRGRLLEPREDVRALLDAAVPWSKKGRVYSEQACEDVRALAARLRYRVDIGETESARGVELTLDLAPVTLVRYVSIRGNLSLLEGLLALFRFDFSPVYSADIERRLRLRPGAALADDPERRRRQLDDEKERVVEYLARRGYFDAQVKVSTHPGGNPSELTLQVDVKKGSGYTVGKVTASGNSAVDDRAITDAMAQRVCLFNLCLRKDRFSFDELKEDREHIREIFQKRGYPGVRVKTTFDLATSHDPVSKTVRFEVQIEERKKLTVSFEGNKSKDDRTLRNLLTFNEAGAFDDYEAENSAEAIRRAYQGSGRFLTTVAFTREKLEPSEQCPTCKPHDAIVFHIDEGPEQRIRGIRFRGNRSFPDDELRKRADLKTEVFPRFQYLFSGGGYVTNLQLSQDVDRILDFYHGQGFPATHVAVRMASEDAALEDMGAAVAMLTADDDRRSLYILFDIDEGPRDVVESVTYTGNHELSAEDLAQDARLRPGRPYTDAARDADVDDIRRAYLSHGYLWAEITPERTGTGAHTRLTIHINEGLRAHTGKITVRGNFKTRRWVVEEVVGLKEGSVLTVDKLELSQAHLRATDLFSGVRTPELVGRDPVNLIFDVDEHYDNKLDGELGGGFSTDNSFFTSLTLGLRNIAGTGISVTASGELGLKRKRGLATLTFPQWVMHRGLALPMKLELQGRITSENTPRFGELRTTGGSAVLSRQLATGVLLNLRYDINLFGRQTELLRPPGANHDLATSPINTLTASLGPVLVIDRRRPTAFMPSSGYIAQASLSLASRYLGGNDDFVKLGLAAQLFVPIGRRVVVANTVRYDEGFPLGGAVLLPEVERFTAGGDTTVRGIEQDRLLTEVIANPLAPAGDVTSFRVVPEGGNIRFIHKLDFQVRVIGEWLASAIFLDTGFIANSFERFDVARRFRHSLGIAFLRLLSPAGSASFEYAVPLDPEVGDDPTGRLHINVGFVF